MVAGTYDAAMIRVFADEGGYTDDTAKGDRGGPTNFGITIWDARKYWKADATAMDVKNMPKAVAADIYRKHYAIPILYDELPAGLDYSELDAAINSGTGRAIPWMGKAAGKVCKTADDAVKIANAAVDKVALIKAYWAIRLSFLESLSIWKSFGRGWLRRCTNGEAAAVRMFLALSKATAKDARVILDKESSTAKSQAKKTGTVAAGSGAGGGAALPQIDTSHLVGKIALAIGIALFACFVIWLIRQAIIHNMRAQAYAAS